VHDLDAAIGKALRLMTGQDFIGAESVLNQCLEEFRSIEDRSLILQELAHVHISSGDLSRAEAALDERERLDPSGPTALSNAYFQLWVREDRISAGRAAALALKRATQESDYLALYSAHSFLGLLAARADDWDVAEESLNALRYLLKEHGAQQMSWGDAVAFLEEASRHSGSLGQSVASFAALLALKIEDADFRHRATIISENANQQS
jgi:hypothetical protein